MMAIKPAENEIYIQRTTTVYCRVRAPLCTKGDDTSRSSERQQYAAGAPDVWRSRFARGRAAAEIYKLLVKPAGAICAAVGGAP
jgi:hypothetical protein